MEPFSDVLEKAFRPLLSGPATPMAQRVSTFVAAYRQFELTGETPAAGYLAMRQLFCATNGEFNDAVHRLLLQHRGPAPRLPRGSGILGELDEARLATIAETIGRDGFYVFEPRLPPPICAALRALALATPCRTGGNALDTEACVRYDAQQVVSNRYDLPEAVVAANPNVQALLLDDSLQAVAAAYFGCEPVLDFVSMWWVAPFSRSAEALSKAAQLYHFDMDRLKFLKFFIYLSDVTALNSPHCYVRGSCQRKPAALLRDGRVADEELARHYRAEDLVELTAPCGTIFAVDTRGFHKGKAVEAGERLLLQLEFTNSLFGQNYGTVAVPAEACTPPFAAYLAAPRQAGGRFRLAAV